MYLDSRLLKKMFTSKQIKTWLDVFATKLANFALEEFWVCHGKWKVSLSLYLFLPISRFSLNHLKDGME